MSSVPAIELLSFGLLLVLVVVVQDLLHLIDLRLIVGLLEDLLSALGDELLEHLLFFLQQELEPETFALRNNLDVQLLEFILVLLLDELIEGIGTRVEVSLPLERISQHPNLVQQLQHDAEDDKVEQRQLDDQQEDIEEGDDDEVLNERDPEPSAPANPQLLRLVPWVILNLVDRFQVCLVQRLVLLE